jgi:hypothetical protein
MKSTFRAFEQSAACFWYNLPKIRAPFLIFFIIFSYATTSWSQITGVVFRDFNGNGTREANETGVGGITVQAYDDNDPVGSPTATTTTNGTGPLPVHVGTYTLAGLAAGTTYRIEFSWPVSGAGNLGHLSPGPAGGTTVQFAANGASNINLGFSPDGQYCPPVGDIDIVTALAISGNPFAPGNNLANDAVLESVDYLAANTTPAPTALATASQVGGFLYGLAKDPNNSRVFGVNALKRHVSFGPDRNNPTSDGEGGAIYMTNLNAALPNASVYLDLVHDLGIDIGQALIPNNAGRGLPAIKGNPSLDVAAFAQAGKMGLGDLEISDDGAFLFVVNLFDRRVYQIPTADVDDGAPYSYATLPDFPNYAAGCTNGVQRPYGLSYHDGDIYLGVVCTGENNTTTNTNADLTAFVYRYDLNGSSGGGWSTVISFPLTYQKGFAFYNEAGTNQWYNWTDVFSYVNPLTQGSLQSSGTFGGNMFRPQPLLSDIEFDEDGSMILGLMDRSGNQLGHRNSWPTDINQLTTAVTGGDILRTYLNPATGTYVLENAGVAGPYSSSGTGTGQQGPGGPASNQGPGGGEFFWRDYGNNAFNVTAHSENSNGGLAICPGTREVVLSAYDPLDELDSGGYIVLSNNDGSKVRGYRLYIDDGFPPATGTTGKGNGVGDIEFVINAVPIEVGNRVWNDTDQDGVQDPGENGIAGLTVQLWADTDNNGSADTKVAETVTDASGRYLFSKTGTNTLGQTENWSFFNGDNDRVEPSKNYEIRLGTGQAPLSGLSLTTANSAASGGVSTNNNITDLRDSDGVLSGSDAVITFSTGAQGDNNHTLDFGFKMLSCAITLSNTASDCYDSNGSAAGGTSVLDVSVNVGFSGLTSGATINVTVPGATPATRTITPTVGQTQAIVYFTVPTAGASFTITATSSDALCTNTLMYTAPTSNCIMDTVNCTNCFFYVSSTDNALHKISQAGNVFQPDPFKTGPVSPTAPAVQQAEAILFYDNNSKYFRSYWRQDWNTYMEFFDANTHTLLNSYTIPAPMLDAVMHPDGDKFYATFRDQVRLVNLATGATIYTASTPDSWGLDINPLTGEVFVANGWTGFAGVYNDGIVQRFNADLTNPTTVVPYNATGFTGMKFKPDGTFYVVNMLPQPAFSTPNQEVRHYQANGTLISTIKLPPTQLSGQLWDVDTALDGNIYIVGSGTTCLIKINMAQDRFEGIVTQAPPNASGKNLASACVCPVLNNLQTTSPTSICAGETITQFSATTNSAAIRFVLFNSLPADPYSASGTFLGTVTGSTSSVAPRTLNGSFVFNTPGTYYVYALLNDLCGLDASCRPAGQLQITVTAPPTATAGGPDNVCQSATPTAIALSGASVGGGAATGAWSIVSGGGTLSSTAQTATPATVTYTPAANYTGSVILRLTTNDPAGTCVSATADRTITVGPIPDLPAGPLPLTNVCPAVAADLTSLNPTDANNTTGTITYHSTLNGASNPANNTTDIVPDPTSVAVPGTYYIRKTTATGCFDYVTVAATATTNCCVPPTLSTTNATVCPGTIVRLSTLVTNNTPTGTLTFHPTQTDANNGTNPLFNENIIPVGTVTYYVRSVVTGGCAATAAATITVSTPPALAVVNGSICAGGNINLSSLVTNGGGGTLSYHTTQTDAAAGTNALVNPVVVPVTATNFYVRSANASGCFTVREIVVGIQPAVCAGIQISGPN